MPIQRIADSGTQAGAIGSAGLGVAINLNQIAISAIQDGEGKLKIITWNISEGGKTITRISDSGNQAGAVSLLDLCLAGNRYMTAVRGGNGKLKLIGWNIDVSGGIARLGDSDDSEGPVSLIRMMSAGNGAVIGVRDGAGNLVLKNWEINPDGSLKRKGDTALQNQPAGAISLLAVAPSSTGLVSAVRDSSGHLKLINWEIVANGGIKRLGDSGQSAGAINTALDMDSADDGLVTAVRTADPRLKLIKWKISDGGSIMRIGDSGDQAGDVDLVSAVALESGDEPFGGGRRILTAVRTREKTLLLVLWHVTDAGQIQRIGDSGEHAGGVDLVRILRAPVTGLVFVTAVRDSQGHLKLITWTVT